MTAAAERWAEPAANSRVTSTTQSASRPWHAACSLFDVTSPSPRRRIWIAAVLVFACALVEQARGKLQLSKLQLGQMDEYGRTLQALEQYRILAAEDDGTVLPQTEQAVEPGDSYEGLPRLIRLLQRIGDLPAEFVPDEDDVYQGALVAAVKRFQTRHGLEANGRIDRATLAQLNTPLAVRVHQLELALQRWRRRPYDPTRPAIVLNLPEFRLRAFSASNHLDLEMKIVIGQALGHRTPLLSSLLTSVVFRPYWNVPVRIQREEMVPKILDDPSYLPANHLEIINPQGLVLSDDISNGMIAELRSGMLHLRQTPGPKNSLGLAKFVFPNEYGVYMHDTPVRWLFTQARRDFSHGCIRLERAEDLAEWVLRAESGWPRERIQEAMQGTESIAVKLTRPIQVVTIYDTAVVLETGEVHFLDDIYGEDTAFQKEVARASSIPSPRS